MQVYHYGKFDGSNDVEASFFQPKQEVNILVDGPRRQHNSRSVILFYDPCLWIVFCKTVILFEESGS